MMAEPLNERLTALHNENAVKAVALIVGPVLRAGGNQTDAMVVLESVVLGALLAIYPGKPALAAGMLEEALVPRVLGRLTGSAKKPEVR